MQTNKSSRCGRSARSGAAFRSSSTVFSWTRRTRSLIRRPRSSGTRRFRSRSRSRRFRSRSQSRRFRRSRRQHVRVASRERTTPSETSPPSEAPKVVTHNLQHVHIYMCVSVYVYSESSKQRTSNIDFEYSVSP